MSKLSKLTKLRKSLILSWGALLTATVIHADADIFDYVYKTREAQFDHVIIFGDSLADPGTENGGRFVAGGRGYPGFFDVLSRQLAHEPSVAVSTGGNNYAVAASASEAVYRQAQGFIANNGGRVSKDNFYLYWAGGSDVNTSIIMNLFKLPFYDFQKPDYTLYQGAINPARYIHDGAKLLIDAGAPVVVVPNVPSAGYAPIISLFYLDIALVTVSTFLAILPPSPIPLGKNWTLGIRETVGLILDPIFSSLPPPGQGMEALNNRTIDLLQIQFFLLPRPLVAKLYYTLVNIQNDVTRQFNYSALEVLKSLDGNILYADIAGLLLEGINHADDWGIDSTTGQACKVAFTSAECTKANGTFDDHQSYLFGDWFHPSWQTHVAIAQYILAIFNAPDQVAAIMKQLINLNYGSQATLQGHLSAERLLTPAGGEFRVYTSYTGLFDRPRSYIGGEKNSYTNVLNIGFDYIYQPNMMLGALLSLSYGKQKPYRDFNFKQDSQNILLYGQWQSADRQFWSNVNLNYAHLKAKDIDRSIRLFKIKLLEPDNTTTASMTGINGRLGWNIWAEKDRKAQTGPFAGLSFNHYKLKGYTEKNNNFTSMHFADASYNQNYAGLGWYINAADWTPAGINPINLSAELSYNQQFKQKDLKIPARLKSSPLTFRKNVQLAESKRWFDLNSQMNMALTQDTKINLGLGLRYDNQKNKNFYLSLGIAKKF